MLELAEHEVKKMLNIFNIVMKVEANRNIVMSRRKKETGI